LRSLFRNIFLILNLALVLSLLMSYLAAYISPETAWIFAFFGLAYPYILLVNLCFVLFWIFFRKWYFLLSLVFILAGWGSLKKLLQLRSKKEKMEVTGNTFRIISYNVRLFNYYLWEKDTALWPKMMEYLHNESPAVICFQEFMTLPGGNIPLSRIKQELKELPYSHVNYTHRVPGRMNFGLATFSKFPIIHKGNIKYENSLNGIIYSDMVIGTDTVRVYNCHLQSVKLKQDYNQVLDSLIFNYDQRHLKEVKAISVRLRDAYIQRAYQAEMLSRHIKTSPYPVIVCGDFNDTPFSYCYYRLSRGLRDAFVASGSGTGNTYRQNIAPIRIDYILYSPSMRAYHYFSKKTDWSDHYPVRCDFTFLQKGDGSNPHSRR
jgi:endonuclease/exonuclease/phosphatase family metal-dependent hydrolase